MMPPEHFGRQDAAALLTLRERLLAATGQMRRIALELLARERWDLACLVFGTTHRAGHYLWDLSQIDAAALGLGERAQLEGALAEIYAAVDGAVGEICAGLDEDTLVLAFAVHGMGPNPGWADLLADMLADAGGARGAVAPRRGLLFALKSLIPFHWVRPLLRRLPPAATDRLVALWSARMLDWAATRQFPLPMDHAGYLRINLQGRERDGIVPQGAAYEALLGELAGLVRSLRDAASGRPLAAAVDRSWQELPDAAERDLLPDLLVTWAGPRAGEVREVVSDLVPGWRFPVPAHLPSGRAGNHLGHGWYIAAGPGVVPGTAAGNGDIVDLVPTAAAALGLETRSGLARSAFGPRRQGYGRVIEGTQGIADGGQVECDVCIVGGGPAGITLARELEPTGARICLLEAGGLRYRSGAQALLDGEVEGDSYPRLRETRFAGLGGASELWAGWCRPLDPIDLEVRDWVPSSGWPIGRDSLDPFYHRAHVACGLAQPDYEASSWETRSGRRRLAVTDATLATSIFHVEPAPFWSGIPPRPQGICHDPGAFGDGGAALPRGTCE